MVDRQKRVCTAFAGARMIAQGAVCDVAVAVKAHTRTSDELLLVFDDATGMLIDLDLRGSDVDIAARFAERANQEAVAAERGDAKAAGPGRPKLGVVAREVTLLPRHWAWLAAQRGGASAALRRLVEEAIRSDGGRSAARAAQEACYRFCTAMAGDRAGYEEAMRALFRGDAAGFATLIAGWPEDVRAYAGKLAAAAMQRAPGDGAA